MSEHTKVVGKVKTLSLVRDGRKWFVVVVADTEPELLPETGQGVGIDVGINRFLTTSDGPIDADLNGAINIYGRGMAVRVAA